MCGWLWCETAGGTRSPLNVGPHVLTFRDPPFSKPLSDPQCVQGWSEGTLGHQHWPLQRVREQGPWAWAFSGPGASGSVVLSASEGREVMWDVGW